MAAFVFFAAFVLGATAVHVATGQPGVLFIDCGLEANYSGYKDSLSDTVYISDGQYVDGGENHRVAAELDGNTGAFSGYEYRRTLRSFPSGVRNCYTLPTESGAKYLVRMEFYHGHYDGKKSSSLHFDLHLGTNYWKTYDVARTYWAEAVFVAWASWVPLCLVNTGGGTPFVSSVELRQLGASMYPEVTADHSMSMYDRRNMGGDYFIRYPADRHHRFWWPSAGPQWANVSTPTTIQPDAKYAVPTLILQTAVTALGNGTVLNVTTWSEYRVSFTFMAFLHFADFQNVQLRQFSVVFNDNQTSLHSPAYLAASCVHTNWHKAINGEYRIALAATAMSVLPPMLNAYEIYHLIAHDTPRTFSEDFDAIMAIKLEYGVKKNWMGDPCFPTKYAWDGVKCSSGAGNTTRIISLDLSNSNLRGVISSNFTLLTALKYLNLSGNRLSGPIPDSLCKNNAGSHIFRYESYEDMCKKSISSSPSRNRRTTVLSVLIVVPVLVVVVLALSYLTWRQKRKPNKPEAYSAPGSIKIYGGHLQNTENRQFTYKELEKCTNNFERFIGRGGFGLVYYGRLEDDTEVAVKMRSESSAHGLDAFLAEVQSLTKVHHRNLVSLVGYCWEKDHLALIYEYMCQGNLCDHLREAKSGVAKTLKWATRVRVVLEAAQGLDYLHKGCSLPIIHRDVKSSNILLGQNLQAKIADFGLCKTYLSDTQTHISTVAAGSAGYIDPEYYHIGRLTESSDVYSFGVVLLEVVTGEPPILANHVHIVHRMKQKITAGNISAVADARLGGAYDVSSMWKVIDTAFACTADSCVGRPTMAAVVVQLKESLALEEAREDSGVRGSPASTLASFLSTVGPSTR